MKHLELTEQAQNALKQINEPAKSIISSTIDEAQKQGFYNHPDYSNFRDYKNRVWDKIDVKEEPANHRIFFTEQYNIIYILDIMPRELIDYQDPELYRHLEKVITEEKNLS